MASSATRRQSAALARSPARPKAFAPCPARSATRASRAAPAADAAVLDQLRALGYVE